MSSRPRLHHIIDNSRPDVGVSQRQQSPIIGLKNFNNWVKSVLIARYAHPPLKAGCGKVLDMGCGKGGDLNKWQKARVREYIGVGACQIFFTSKLVLTAGKDIAALSIQQARGRWSTSHASSSFRATFHALDCYRHPLTDVIPPSALPPEGKPFDVVSMQFCMHYAFESEEQARTMLSNVSRWLRRGATFIGTIPNDDLLLYVS